MTIKQYEYLRSKAFIIKFLETIEQPLPDEEVKKILEASKYLNELLQQQEQREAINQMLSETF